MNRLRNGAALALLCAASSLHAATESFDAFPVAPFSSLSTAVGALSVTSGTASISTATGATGLGTSPKLRLHGGLAGSGVTLALPATTTAPHYLSFNAERWTSNNPFTFSVHAIAAGTGTATLVYNGDSLAVNANTGVSVIVPAGTAALRFACTSPADAGVMLDNLGVNASPFALATYQPAIPVLVRKSDNPVAAINIRVPAGTSPLPTLNSVTVNLDGTTALSDLTSVRLVSTGATRDIQESYVTGTVNTVNTTAFTAFGSSATPAARLTFSGSKPLAAGDNWFWVMVNPAASADLDHRVDAGFESLKLADGLELTPETPSPAGTQRIGIAFKKRNDDGIAGYRIPGLCTSLSGTLIAVYDNRYTGNPDLPADIDVGVSRSTDGGRTWSPMSIAMVIPADMRVGTSNGVGDPTVFVDKVSGRIWVSALWASNGKAYNASAPGIAPSVTGQLVMAYSDDDGLTWSRPYSITPEVKDPTWRLLFNGPGSAITKSDGTLVMPVQYRLGDASGTVYSSIIYSTDRGLSWDIARGVMARTNEAQVVELTDGSLLLNCRSEAGGGRRRVATTRNLGETWSVVTPRAGTSPATDLTQLADPTCQGAILRHDDPVRGPLFFFSNPAVSAAPRREMTLKVSRNNCRTWPINLRTTYDYRNCFGYSSITMIGDDHVGVLYEGSLELRFLRIPVAELLGE